MTLHLNDISTHGPALPESFLRLHLGALLEKAKLLPKTSGDDGKKLEKAWDLVRTKLRRLGAAGGSIRVANHILEPLVPLLKYDRLKREEEIQTREGAEDGGWFMSSKDGASLLRCWAVGLDTDLDAPNKRGRAYRFSPSRIAQRVLLAKGERVGLLTDGLELRILLCDPARPDSYLSINLTTGWLRSRTAPDSFRLLLALASPKGVAAIPGLLDEARLRQSEVTKDLRHQARRAVEEFIQELLDHPDNAESLRRFKNKHDPGRTLWTEGLVFVYRLLFLFKLEASADPARAFSFASTSLWRNTYSPSVALGRYAQRVLKEGLETGAFLAEGLRNLFRLFVTGIQSSEIHIRPLGGMLFGRDSTSLIDSMRWSERAVARLLDNLLWTPEGSKTGRMRVHYGGLEVEDLGRVYEALLELEPGISAEPMCRLRRDKLEVVIPADQGAPYRAASNGPDKKKSKIEWIEDIPAGRFYLRVGLGRKSSGSYYTPDAFVRFLVRETLGPQVDACSSLRDPHPGKILQIKVLDPAMGSGHFLVEACRFLGENLYESCRQCDELAEWAEADASRAASVQERDRLLSRAAELRRRIADLPDPNDEMLAYLPSRAPEREESGVSQSKALALCRRLIAVHCLYGVDKNPLAVELAKVVLWLESYSEGYPLTFLDHRLVCGDSLTGPFFSHLLRKPISDEPIGSLFSHALADQLEARLVKALREVAALESSVGKDEADIQQKRAAKERLDAILEDLRFLAQTWSGGTMLGKDHERGDSIDQAYEDLAQMVGNRLDVKEALPGLQSVWPILGEMIEAGRESVSYDLLFPEVFYSDGGSGERKGFHAAIGNPPWDAVRPKAKEFYAAFDLRILDTPTKRERKAFEERLSLNPVIVALHSAYEESFTRQQNAHDRLYEWQVVLVNEKKTGGDPDLAKVFMERAAMLLRPNALVGLVVPSAFHANAGSTGLRRLYMERMQLKCCYSFENTKKIFEIDSRLKFALIVAVKDGGPTKEFPCAFYLHDLEWLFGDNPRLSYTLDFVRKTGGDFLSFPELRSAKDAEAAKGCFSSGIAFENACRNNRVSFRRELHMTDDSWRFQLTADHIRNGDDPRDSDLAIALFKQGMLVLHEGKTFWHFDDHWESPPTYLVPIDKIREKKSWLANSQYFRLAFRNVASSTNERTLVMTLLPPLWVSGNSAIPERTPSMRPACKALYLAALSSSFAADWVVRQLVSANVNLFILNRLPLPFSVPETFAIHAALRLTCNHPGYEPLWREQVGDAWREPGKASFTWPVLEGDDARWAVRAAIDAVVADAYGLTREQYAHILSSFSHKSYPKAPDLCLAAYDELKSIGPEAFWRRHDPYWDIPLNESLPKPVITIPGITDSEAQSQMDDLVLFDASESDDAPEEEDGEE